MTEWVFIIHRKNDIETSRKEIEMSIWNDYVNQEAEKALQNDTYIFDNAFESIYECRKTSDFDYSYIYIGNYGSFDIKRNNGEKTKIKKVINGLDHKQFIDELYNNH